MTPLAEILFLLAPPHRRPHVPDARGAIGARRREFVCGVVDCRSVPLGDLRDHAKMIEQTMTRIVGRELTDLVPIDRVAVGDLCREFVEGVAVLVDPGWRLHQPDDLREASFRPWL